MREQIEWAEELTAHHTERTLFVAFDYGGRAEILHAAEAYGGGGEEEFRKHLYAPDLEDPQLIIRTGGELRLSNFLLWESAYSELYFSDKMWPDFDREEFERAVSSYGSSRLPVRGQVVPQASGAAPPRRSEPASGSAAARSSTGGARAGRGAVGGARRS